MEALAALRRLQMPSESGSEKMTVSSVSCENRQTIRSENIGGYR